LEHVLQVLAQRNQPDYDYIMVLEPTSPLRSAETIRGCIRTIVERDAQSLLAVRETRENIGTIDDGYFRPLRPDAPRRRQDRKPFFVESSTVYICRADYLKATGTLVAKDWCAYVVPDIEAVDINTLEDFALAECLVRMRKEG
jgi:CMP-N,N'-diacetyllegionaminic acid synthase